MHANPPLSILAMWGRNVRPLQSKARGKRRGHNGSNLVLTAIS
jgi:hypothetical protein